MKLLKDKKPKYNFVYTSDMFGQEILNKIHYSEFARLRKHIFFETRIPINIGMLKNIIKHEMEQQIRRNSKKFRVF